MRALYKQYFQKSKVFLYPVLGFTRGISTKPMNTYIAWKSLITPEDKKLICTYDPKQNDEYQNYRNNIIIPHDMLIDIRIGENNEEIFIFELANMGIDYENFLKGRYSMLTDNHKELILTFFDGDRKTSEFIESYLFPEDYYNDYSKLLNVEVQLLKDVGELCAPPDIEKETLLTQIIRDTYDI